MTVFKGFLRILNKNKISVILYTTLLVVIISFQFTNTSSSTDFSLTKPSIYIINEDEGEENIITNSLVKYLTENSEIVELENIEEKIDDAVFYRNIDLVLTIPKGYNSDFLAGKNPELLIKTPKTSGASYAKMLLEKYIKIANSYNEELDSREDLIKKIESSLLSKVDVEMLSKLDTKTMNKAVSYYNFINYSMIASVVYIVGTVLASFNNDRIKKRILISAMDYKKHNFILILSNMLFAIFLWAIYVVISYIIIGSVILSTHGYMFMLNSLAFLIAVVTLAFFIGTVAPSKNVVDILVNIVSLGSSFLCGAFVPMRYLPDAVVKIAHVLPSYWFVKSNELIGKLESVDFESTKPIVINMVVLLGFALLFIILTNIYSKKKQRS